jgi:hypothetical protein
VKLLLGVTASVLFISGHILRTIRWRITIGNDNSFSTLFKRLSLAYLIDMFVPLRFGQAIRIFPMKGIESNKTKLFCSLIFEKALDVVLVGLIFIILPPTRSQYFSNLSSTWVWILLLSIILLTSLYTKHGQRILLKISFFGMLEPFWIKFLYQNQQIYRRVHSARFKYVVFTVLMWGSYILAVNLFSVFLPVDFSGALVGLYGNFVESPTRFIFKSATLNAATGLVFMMSMPLLIITLVGALSNKKGYEFLRKSEKKLSGSIPLPEILFSPIELREYMSNLQSRKNNMIEELSKSFEFKINFLRDLSGSSGATTLVVHYPAINRLSIIKMANEEFLMQRLNAQFMHIKEMMKKKVPVTQVEKVFGENQSYLAYEMPFSEKISPIHKSFDRLPINSTMEILSEMMMTLNSTLYQIEQTDSMKYRKNILYYYLKKIDHIFEELDPFLRATTINDRISINNKEYDALNRTRFKMWLTQFGIVGNGCQDVHGDLTFQNILLDSDKKSVLLIDSNPNQAIQHPSIDLGKILQSLRLRYELFDSQKPQIRLIKGEINYKLPQSDVYYELESRTDEWLYSKYLIENFPNIKLLAHAQFGMHLLRLLPYKLRYRPEEFLIFYAELIKHINLEI